MPLEEPMHRLSSAPSVQLPHGGLIQWYSVSVLRFADGVTRAYLNHLDLPSRRLVPTDLGQPSDDYYPLPWHVGALSQAVEEVEARATDDWRL